MVAGDLEVLAAINMFFNELPPEEHCATPVASGMLPIRVELPASLELSRPPSDSGVARLERGVRRNGGVGWLGGGDRRHH